MFYADLVSFCQGLTAEPYQDRFTTVQWCQWISQAQREVARETRCLEARKGIQTIIGQPEYPLPPLVGIKRVYMAGPGFAQRLVHTSIPQMEGDQLRIYDQTGGTTASIPGVNSVGSSGSAFTPQWMTFQPAPYPVENCDFGFGYTPLPMIPGRRPAYYLRGIGRIGVVPPPSFAYFIVLDVVDTTASIDPVTIAETLSPFPDDFIEAISWYALTFAYHSDQSVGSESLEADAMANYTRCMGRLQSFVSNINEDDPQGPVMLTHRSFYEAAACGGDYDYEC